MTSASTKRVSNIERIGRVFAAKDKEIQRLRAAMVHAMIDCQWIVTLPDARADVRRRAHRALTDLKTALEKK